MVFLAVGFLAVAGGDTYLGSMDFRAYLTGGKMALSGAGAKFYDLPTQFEVQRALWSEMTEQSQLLPFLAPPFVALLFAPLAGLPLLTGYLLWSALNAVLLWWIVTGVLEELYLQGPKRLVAVVMMLSFAPVLFTVMQGQVPLFVVLALLQSFRAARAGRDFRAGLWLAIFLFRPQLAIAPLLIFAWKRRARLLGGFALGAAVLGGISLGVVGWEGLANYRNLLQEVPGWQNLYGVRPQQMQTWRGLLHSLGQTNDLAPIRFFWLAGIFAALGALFWCWRGPWNPDGPRFERQWALIGIVALFCCPYLYSNDLSLLLISGFLIYRAARSEGSKLSFLPFLGYAAVLSWAILLLVSARFPSLVVLFEVVAIAALCWGDRKIPLATAS